MDSGEGGTQPPADPAAPDRLAEFRAQLAALTPRMVVTNLLVAANVLAFGMMVASGVHPLSPTAESLLGWGGNYGPLSMGAGWWRLVASMFLHGGLVHLALNMWVLWDTGRILERVLGPLAFAVTYLLAGVAGSLVSTLWQPIRVSVGASGAIFGLFGALGAFLIRQRRVVPRRALSHLASMSALFVVYNIAFGATRSEVDMAAHVGGLVGGFVFGAFVVHELSPVARARNALRTATVLLAGSVALAFVWVGARRQAEEELRLARRALPGAALAIPAGKEIEARTGYADGMLTVDLRRTGGRVVVTWRTTDWMPVEELEKLFLDPLVDGMGTTVQRRNDVAVKGGPGKRYVLQAAQPGAHLVLTWWWCGQRLFNLWVGPRADASELEERVRGSFECAPDPALEGKHPPIGVQLVLAPGFGRLPADDQLLVGSLEGEEATFVRFARPSEALAKELVPKILGSLLAATGTTDVKLQPMVTETGPNGPRMVWRGEGKHTGRSARLLVSLIDCTTEGYAGVYMGDAQLPEARGLDLLMRAGCAAAPAPLPSMAEVAAEACAKGDPRGCPD